MSTQSVVHAQSSADESVVGDSSPPGGGSRRYLEQLIRYDVPASLVVFLVALPLSLGIAIASGAPIMAGLIAAIVGGVVVGAVGGSPLQVSGPAAGLTVVVAELIGKFGWKVTCLITVGAGILQIVFGLSRIARAALAIAPVVVHAMLAGIGITIALQQVHVLLGGSSASSALDNLRQLPAQIGALHVEDLMIGLVVIATLLGWRYLPAGVRKVPAALVGIVLATLASLALPIDVERIALDGSLLDSIGLPALPDGQWLGVATGILTIALIASVESLLSAVAVDKMHSGPRSNFDREMLGQGTANMVSGAIGGLPVTGVIVRSATNVEAGAKSRASSIMHGLWILLFSAALAGLVQQIPKSALAGLLIVIGIQLVKLAHIRLARRTGDLWVYGITVVGVVFLNLLEGVLIGLALAIALLVWRVIRAPVTADELGDNDSGKLRVLVEGSCTFLVLPKLTSVLAGLPPRSDVTVELSVDFLDHAVFDVIEEWARQYELAGGSVIIDEVGSVSMESATTGPPKRGAAVTDLRGLLAPWGSWQPQASGRNLSSPPALRPILDGVSNYHRHRAEAIRPHMDQLRDGQNPDSLFLTCADSRVVPNIITSSGPGDLFTVRNVGNLVPAGGRDTSVEAALAFGIDELGVSSVVVCGHSGCGAMQALLTNGPSESGVVGEWLRHAETSLQAYTSGHPVARAAAEAGFSEVDQLGMVNVAVQLQTLERHPLVGQARVDGRLRIAGLFFDIGSARVIEVTASGIGQLIET